MNHFVLLKDVLADYEKCMTTLENDIAEIKENITELQTKSDIVEEQMMPVG